MQLFAQTQGLLVVDLHAQAQGHLIIARPGRGTSASMRCIGTLPAAVLWTGAQAQPAP